MNLLQIQDQEPNSQVWGVLIVFICVCVLSALIIAYLINKNRVISKERDLAQTVYMQQNERLKIQTKSDDRAFDILEKNNNFQKEVRDFMEEMNKTLRRNEVRNSMLNRRGTTIRKRIG